MTENREQTKMRKTMAALNAMERKYALLKSWMDSAGTADERLEHAMAIIGLLSHARQSSGA